MVVMAGATVDGLLKKGFRKELCCGARCRKFACEGANVVGVELIEPARIDVERARLWTDTLRFLRRCHGTLIERTFRCPILEGTARPDGGRGRQGSEELERIVNRGRSGRCARDRGLLAWLRVEVKLLLRLAEARLTIVLGRGDGNLEVVRGGRIASETLLWSRLGRGTCDLLKLLLLLLCVEEQSVSSALWLGRLLSEGSRCGDDGLSEGWCLGGRLLGFQYRQVRAVRSAEDLIIWVGKLGGVQNGLQQDT
uniref:Uncharacterized protein n=1 Tax=Anopheles coluzzii TaxID=1518534 RepID=A0A8W7Q3M3_ANOCL